MLQTIGCWLKACNSLPVSRYRLIAVLSDCWETVCFHSIVDLWWQFRFAKWTYFLLKIDLCALWAVITPLWMCYVVVAFQYPQLGSLLFFDLELSDSSSSCSGLFLLTALASALSLQRPYGDLFNFYLTAFWCTFNEFSFSPWHAPSAAFI